jgi:8-oxo-dGTP diphosphatase
MMRVHAKKPMAAGALIGNAAGQVLIVKPVYKPGWEIPGGMIEDNESPVAACRREVREELGLEIAPGRLLCIEYASATHDVQDRVLFIFDGGVIRNEDEAKIVLQADELSAYRFAAPADLPELLSDTLAGRVAHALAARIDGQMPRYLENGRPHALGGGSL